MKSRGSWYAGVQGKVCSRPVPAYHVSVVERSYSAYSGVGPRHKLVHDTSLQGFQEYN